MAYEHLADGARRSSIAWFQRGSCWAWSVGKDVDREVRDRAAKGVSRIRPRVY
jgi:hypothetical protein